MRPKKNSSSSIDKDQPSGQLHSAGGRQAVQALLDLKIGMKLSLAFALLVSLTLVVVGLAYNSSSRAIESNIITKDQRVPAVSAATEAQANLLRMLSSIRAHIIFGDIQSRTDYEHQQENLASDLNSLDRLYDTPTLNTIRSNSGQLTQLSQEIFSLRGNLLVNEPAQRIMVQEADFNYHSILDKIKQIALAQAQRPPSARHTDQLVLITDFQRSYALMVSALRRYIATGTPIFKYEYKQHRLENSVAWKMLIAEREFLLPYQQINLQEIDELRRSLAPLPPKMFAIVESEQTRKDLYLFKTKFEPISEEMLRRLDIFVSEQTQLLETQLVDSSQRLYLTQQQTIIGGLAALLLGIGLAFLSHRGIAGPIVRLTDIATRLSKGDLTIQAPAESRDEIGVLALVLNQTTGQLRRSIRKLEDQAAQLSQANRELTKEVVVRKEAESQVRVLNQELEKRVTERTVDLEIAKQQAEVANQAKSDFLARMSHELRTPLNAILGYTQIFMRRNLDEDLARGLDTIQQSGEHLLTLINDILDTAKIEAGKVELSTKPVRLASFLETILGIVRSRVEAKRLHIRLETPTPLPNGVMADTVRLRQVLLNLLNNAIKFTDTGVITLSVSCPDTEQQDDNIQLRFAVTDTGIGIEADHLKRIFSPFEQASDDPGRRSGGSGLGLFISRQLVALMGGELIVESVSGRGSTFSFTIIVPRAWDIPEIEAAGHTEIIGYSGQHCKIMVVDDIASNRAVLEAMLTSIGFEVLEAADGQQAILAAQENPPDVILLDRYMPVMDGLASLRHIRGLPELREVPVIAISASVAEEDRRELLEAGFDGFVSKPVHWPDLADILQTHLNLEWKYLKEKVGAEEEVVDFQTLTPPPMEELTLLKELVLMGDMATIISHADRIELLGAQYCPFARHLRKLAETYEDRQIQILLQQYMEKNRR